MKLRIEIKKQAKQNFAKQYWVSVGVFMLIMLCMGVISWFTSYPNGGGGMQYSYFYAPFTGGMSVLGTIGLAASVLLSPPLTVGYAAFALRIYKGETGDIGGMFKSGFANYWHNVGGMLLTCLFTFLWTLLFIVPGIIKAIAYSMTPYILSDLPSVTPTNALKVSMEMTKGHKGKIFLMYLSFIGWGILTALTGGILAIFYTGPYLSTSLAGMYCELKQNAFDKGIITTEELGN